jgi:hypothetical protein
MRGDQSEMLRPGIKIVPGPWVARCLQQLFQEMLQAARTGGMERLSSLNRLCAAAPINNVRLVSLAPAALYRLPEHAREAVAAEEGGSRPVRDRCCEEGVSGRIASDRLVKESKTSRIGQVESDKYLCFLIPCDWTRLSLHNTRATRLQSSCLSPETAPLTSSPRRRRADVSSCGAPSQCR